MPDIVFYVSGHGFGHAVREAEVVRALLELDPTIEVQVRTTAPAFLFPERARVVETSLDIGVIQPNSLDLWPDQTLARYAELIVHEPGLIDRQASELSDARLIVADVPPAAFAIAGRLGIPGVAIANFSWDWIYDDYAGTDAAARRVVDHIRAQYATADLLLRLPLSDGLDVFPRVEEIPLIARRATTDRETVRRRLGVPLDKPLVLVSFGGIGFDGLSVERLADMPDQVFAVPNDVAGSLAPNVVGVPRSSRDYPDLLGASDVVLTKLGYGIVADCIANRVPLLYVPRGGFREEPVLEAAVRQLGCGVAINRAALEVGSLLPHIEQALSLRPDWGDQPVDGAQVAARRLLSLIDRRSR
jgi:L-arabinokinase